MEILRNAIEYIESLEEILHGASSQTQTTNKSPSEDQLSKYLVRFSEVFPLVFRMRPAWAHTRTTENSFINYACFPGAALRRVLLGTGPYFQNKINKYYNAAS